MATALAPRPAPGSRVAVAMSGGVDSSVTAALLAAQGFEVVGLTLTLFDPPAAGADDGCAAGRHREDARRVAERLGIAHHVIDARETFARQVVEPFVASYRRGETPLPCALCNRAVKFGDLLEAAERLGCAFLATGHYARRTLDAEGRPGLARGADAGKDQSYFLFALSRRQLARLRFPLGGLDKAATREVARELGLAVADKPESQDICFIPDGDYAAVVKAHDPGAARPGPIVDTEGREVGRHQGIIHYTIGQRRGLGIGGRAEPLYVVRLEPEANRVVVGPQAALGRRRFELDAVNWLGPGEALPARGLACRVKTRNAQAPFAATVSPLPDGRAEVLAEAPVIGVAPGQAGVFYGPEADGALLGGGWISRDPGANR
nr:tRNA 2-thiouridine(34) synthase MnmA [Roseospirillum parvum]